MKTWAWIHGDHASLLRAESYEVAFRMVLAEIMESGCWSTVGEKPTQEEAQTIVNQEEHSIHEITERDVARQPIQGKLVPPSGTLWRGKRRD